MSYVFEFGAEDLTSTAGWGLRALGRIRSEPAIGSTPVLMLVKFPWRERPPLGAHDFALPVHLGSDQLRRRLRRRSVDA